MKWFSIILIITLVSCSENKNPSKPFYAGITSIHTTDSTRIYKPGSDTTDYLYYRPVDLDIWYPAYHANTDTQLQVRYLLNLLETRANYYTASKIADGMSGQLAQFFCNTFNCSDSLSLLNYKTNSFKNAAAASDKYPLVVYMAAFNGMSYENYSLFESLAKKGFVVVSVSSIGRFPGDMTTKKEDLMEQVADGITAINELKRHPNIDSNRIGIIGYSWGGLSGAILAGKFASNVKCIVSLEGSEVHHYGNEDADFDRIRESEEFKSLKFSIPYLRMESAPASLPGKQDSLYNFALYHVKDAQTFIIDSMQHEDFDCFSNIVKVAGNCQTNQRHNSAVQLTVGFLEDKLKNEDNFLPTVNALLNKTIRKK
ncbi:alpha/beta fold hydrolase [Chitinophaga silvatica]|uniref:Alpha/beta fold hydrolase n=1 Tax=Chitinophaga silvatica TaxID=2282649 RepID=A0A3E1YHS4_9BACT|nr:alpha/beta fold hydrolase [Chitinophaga silvatica]RFS26916.1 alpha/beta fold hydrolase [Chitinophaga silvatica]